MSGEVNPFVECQCRTPISHRRFYYYHKRFHRGAGLEPHTWINLYPRKAFIIPLWPNPTRYVIDYRNIPLLLNLCLCTRLPSVTLCVPSYSTPFRLRPHYLDVRFVVVPNTHWWCSILFRPFLWRVLGEVCFGYWNDHRTRVCRPEVFLLSYLKKIGWIKHH